jgi:hypothetical protein
LKGSSFDLSLLSFHRTLVDECLTEGFKETDQF